MTQRKNIYLDYMARQNVKQRKNSFFGHNKPSTNTGKKHMLKDTSKTFII